MNVEALQNTKRSGAAKRSGGDGGRAPRNGTKDWVSIGVGLGAAVALVVLRARSRGKAARALTLAGAAVTGATLVDTLYVFRRRGLLRATPRPVTLRSTITIRRPRDDIYRYFRDLKNLPLFMRHVDSVTETNGHSTWRAFGPAGVRAEWEAEVVADRPGERIAWRSLEGATIPNRGAVEFRDAPQNLGTEVHLELVIEPPGGAAGAGIARLFAELPEAAMKGDLRRLKQILETGEIVCSDASIHRGTHPARPPELHELPLVNGMVQS